MIKYLGINEGNGLIKFNKENEELKVLNNQSSMIDWLWIADEDGELNGKEVKAGDIILRMYGIDDRYKREYFIINDEALKDYYKRVIEYHKQQEEKNSCCDCCEAISLPTCKR